MTVHDPARASTPRIRRSVAVGLIVVIASIIATLGHQSASSSASSVRGIPRGVVPGRAAAAVDGATGDGDGVLPDGVTVFDDERPGVANLDPDLRRALREASRDAADDGIELDVNSGWRSRAYQDQLLRAAIATYGSTKEAARWVATADTSPHVSGDAVDIGPIDATTWLSRRGAHYGLCQVYDNEPWHFELRSEAIDRGCPPTYADPTHDPRMR